MRTGAALLLVLVLLAAAGPAVGGAHWRDVDTAAFGAPPSARHWLGTTQTGRDVYAVTLRGLRRSLFGALAVAALATALAGVIGMTAGLLAGMLGRTLMWITDLLLVIPAFLLLAVLAPALGIGSVAVLLLPAAFLWMVTARAVRGATLALRESEFVLAARYLGAGPLRIAWAHLLPGVAGLLVADGALNVAAAVVTESGLSYFGFGVRPPDASLGTLIAGGQAAVTTRPWPFAAPAALLFLIIAAATLLGDGLRDRLAHGRSGADGSP